MGPPSSPSAGCPSLEARLPLWSRRLSPWPVQLSTLIAQAVQGVTLVARLPGLALRAESSFTPLVHWLIYSSHSAVLPEVCCLSYLYMYLRVLTLMSTSIDTLSISASLPRYHLPFTFPIFAPSVSSVLAITMSQPSSIFSFVQPLMTLATDASEAYNQWVDRDADAASLAANLATWRNLERRAGQVFDDADLPVISAVTREAEEVLMHMVERTAVGNVRVLTGAERKEVEQLNTRACQAMQERLTAMLTELMQAHRQFTGECSTTMHSPSPNFVIASR